MATSTGTVDKKISEVRALTGVRGLAAVFVVIFHFFQPIPLTSASLTFLGHGYLAVDLFFTLSGFVMALNYSGFFRNGPSRRGYYIFLARRFARIYPLYLVSLVLATVLAANGFLEFRGRSLAGSFWLNATMLQSAGPWISINAPSWSISAEFFAYLVFPFIVPLLLFRRPRQAYWIGCMCVMILVGLFVMSLHLGSPKVLDRAMGPVALVRCLPEFFLGVIAYRLTETRLGATLKESNWMGNVIGLAVLVLLSVRYTDLALVLLFPLLVIAMAGRGNLMNRFLGSRPIEHLGLLSFSIYLLHDTFVALLNGMHAKVQRAGFAHPHTYAVAATLVLLFVASVVSYRLIEVPGRKFLRRVLESPSSKAVAL